MLILLQQKPKKEGMAAMEIKHVAIAGIIVVSVAVSYYLIFALPNYNKTKIALETQKLEMQKQKEEQKLAIEKQKIEREQQETGLKQQEKKDREYNLSECRKFSEKKYGDFINLNVSKVDPTNPKIYYVTADVRDKADRTLRQDLDDCEKRFGNLPR